MNRVIGVRYSIYAQERRGTVEEGMCCSRCGNVSTLVHEDGELICTPMDPSERGFGLISCRRAPYPDRKRASCPDRKGG